jgi:hypothetical protein
VILVRFGGGVRRQETIDWPEKTSCPFIYHELVEKQGILFKDVDIASTPGIDTSHGQGTLYLLTGRFDHYEDISHKPFADRFEAKVPTIFEYLRKRYDVPEHQALIINGEDRINEEFYTFSNHHLYGVRYRSTVLSLYRFKSYLLREDLKNPDLSDQERSEKTKQLQEMVNKDYRVEDRHVASPELDQFWAGWREHYGRSGLVNPRGDRVLTALALHALERLRPRLLMINYQDPDYVHWGNPNFYTRAISIIDEGVREIYRSVEADEEYRNNTVPDPEPGLDPAWSSAGVARSCAPIFLGRRCVQWLGYWSCRPSDLSGGAGRGHRRGPLGLRAGPGALEHSLAGNLAIQFAEQAGKVDRGI